MPLDQNSTFRIFMVNPWREPAKQELAWGKVINWSRIICKVGTFIACLVVHTIPWAWGQLGATEDLSTWTEQTREIHRQIYKAQQLALATAEIISNVISSGKKTNKNYLSLGQGALIPILLIYTKPTANCSRSFTSIRRWKGFSFLLDIPPVVILSTVPWVFPVTLTDHVTMRRTWPFLSMSFFFRIVDLHVY